MLRAELRELRVGHAPVATEGLDGHPGADGRLRHGGKLWDVAGYRPHLGEPSSPDTRGILQPHEPLLEHLLLAAMTAERRPRDALEPLGGGG